MTIPPPDEVADALRERLRAADREIQPPADLWQRIRTPAAGRPAGLYARRRRRSRRCVVIGAALAAVIAVTALIWLAVRTEPHQGPPAVRQVVLTVSTGSTPCPPHGPDCALRLATDPYGRYPASYAASGRVRHGDRVTAVCAVTDGTRVTGAAGVMSTRWYLVRTAAGTQGWLPGVRTDDTTEVRHCAPGEVPHRKG